MKTSHILVAIVLLVVAGDAAVSAGHPDVNQLQSAPRPSPAWLPEYIDHGPHDPRLKGYLTPKGIQVDIVADFPTVVNPVGMTFDDEGTPYVLEWVMGSHWNEVPETFRYRDGTTRQVATMKKSVPDVVKVLTDLKKRGVWDEAKIILRDELPSSILIYDEKVALNNGSHRIDQWIYLSGRGTIRRFRKDRPSEMQIVAKGFCGFHHHQVSGMTIGNDGWLYITSGDDDNHVEGSDGSRATVLRSGAVFRSRPDGSKMHVFAQGFRNPYRDVAFDSAYNIFHADNDNEDGTKFTGCRLMHVPEGADFGWRLRQGARCCAPDSVRGAAFGELPGKMPSLLKTGRGAPAGLLIYNDSRFPKPYRGLLFYPDVFRRNIRAYKVEPEGATFKVVEEFELMKSEDPLFRPNQMVTGPDGAIYVVDWRTNSGGAGQLSGDEKHGRIYRLSWSGVTGEPALPLRGMDSWAKIAKLNDADLVKVLSGEEQTDRDRAKRELVRRGQFTLFIDVLKTSKSLQARMSAIGGVQSSWSAEAQAAVIATLTDPSADLRRLAADALALNGNEAVHTALAARLTDPDLKVKRSVALAIGRIGAAGAETVLISALEKLKASEWNDRYLADAFGHALERVADARGIKALVTAAGSHDATLRDRAVTCFLGLRTRPAANAIPQLLVLPGLTPQHRASLLRSYTNYLTEPPLDPLPQVLAFFKQNPEQEIEVKVAALEVFAALKNVKGPEASTFVLKLLDEKDPRLSLAVLRAIEESRTPGIGPEVAIRFPTSSRGEVRAAALRTLRALSDRSLLPSLPTLVKNDPVAEVRLEAFRNLSALDPAKARELSSALVLDRDPALQAEAFAVLSRDVEGAKILGAEFLAKRLPREYFSKVVDALTKFSKTDNAVAQTLATILKDGLLISKDPEKLREIQELVSKTGDPQRGLSVFLDSKAVACIQCHRLENVGGRIGPDLTRVWDTHSLEKVLEAILDPNKEIKEGYHSYTIQTVDGQTISGLKLSESGTEIELKDANGRIVQIKKEDIERTSRSELSLMPANSISGLTFQQFIDLVAFMKNKPAQESLRARGLEFLTAGPYTAVAQLQPGHRDPCLDAADEWEKQSGKVAWSAYKSEADGRLNLSAIFKADNISACALTYVKSPKAQKANLLTGSDDGLRVWVNAEKVHEHFAPRGAAPDEDRVEVSLKEGWNRIVARVFNGSFAHELFLRFDGPKDLLVDPHGPRPEK